MTHIERLLRGSGVSQADLARGIGAGRRTVGRWVKGSHQPSAPHALAVRKFFNRPDLLSRLNRPEVTLDDVLGEAA